MTKKEVLETIKKLRGQTVKGKPEGKESKDNTNQPPAAKPEGEAASKDGDEGSEEGTPGEGKSESETPDNKGEGEEEGEDTTESRLAKIEEVLGTISTALADVMEFLEMGNSEEGKGEGEDSEDEDESEEGKESEDEDEEEKNLDDITDEQAIQELAAIEEELEDLEA